jgi:hypothetical protein
MTVRECHVDGCSVSHPRYPHDNGLVCGACFDYWALHGHRPDVRVEVCSFCPAQHRVLTAFRGGGPRGD